MAKVSKEKAETVSAAVQKKTVKSTAATEATQTDSATKAKPAVKAKASKKTAAAKAAPVAKAAKPAEPVAEQKSDNAESTGKQLPKNVLSPEKKEKFRNMLLKERARFENVQAYHREHALRSRKDVIDSNSTIMTHMADAGSDVFQQTFNLHMLSNENDVLVMVEEALDRLEEDHYGVCLLCGQLIPEKRLEAKPYARFCVKCKERMELLENPEFRHR